MSKHLFGIKLDNLDWLAAEVLRKLGGNPLNFSVIVLFFSNVFIYIHEYANDKICMSEHCVTTLCASVRALCNNTVC